LYEDLSSLVCSSQCRRQDWAAHKPLCIVSRLGSLAKKIFKCVMTDEELLHHCSRFARTGYLCEGIRYKKLVVRAALVQRYFDCQTVKLKAEQISESRVKSEKKNSFSESGLKLFINEIFLCYCERFLKVEM